jgi:hypothetical protein
MKITLDIAMLYNLIEIYIYTMELIWIQTLWKLNTQPTTSNNIIIKKIVLSFYVSCLALCLL